MNFLAHVFLANHDPDGIVGQLCGDFVRGRTDQRYPVAIANGIRVHRAVDSYTDKHPLNSSARSLFSAPHRRFAGIICDVAYDHFLALDWDSYCDTPLPEYAALVDEVLWQRREVLPDNLREFMPYLKSEKILQRNVSRDHIDLTLQRISRRRSSMSPLATAAAPMWKNEALLKQYFDDFFPQLISYAKQQQSKLKASGDRQDYTDV